MSGIKLELRDVDFTYSPGSPRAVSALKGVNLKVRDGEVIGLIGPTGSGKSTLIQLLNGLLHPTRGKVFFEGREMTPRSWAQVRRRVGLVFQYPEHQLFEETVFDDVAFGPKNLGLPGDEVRQRAIEAIGMVGLDPEIGQRSPFELSGGQMRRAAIAGVLAMKPAVLILDEPTAGLDPLGREQILGQIRRMHREIGLTVILVSHSMEEVARTAERLVVLHRGTIVMEGTPPEVFSRAGDLEEIGLGVPEVTRAMLALKRAGLDVPANIYTVDDAVDALRPFWGRSRA